MSGIRLILPFFLLLGLWAQDQELPPQVFRQSVNIVVAPTSVTDHDGNYINGLQPREFRLLDNGKPQNINVDVAYHPISMVVAVQANSTMESMLPKIQKIGSLLEPLVVGDQGQVAIVAFDHRIRVMQDFTSDSTKFSDALKKITPGSSSSRMIDAVYTSIRMLQHQPTDRRRIILLISESRDIASEGRLREALTAAQFADVTIYSVDVSHFVSMFTSKPMPPRPDPFPATARTMPGNLPSTPQTVQQTYGNAGNSANFMPVFVEIFKATKGLFVDNPVEVFTKYTGGREYSFVKQRALEQAVSDIGDELHSQYLISYKPNNKEEGGFHEIQVFVEGYRDAKIHTRPGYWMAAVYDQTGSDPATDNKPVAKKP